MKTSRRIHLATLVLVFLIPAAPVMASQPLRLFEIFAVRIVEETPGGFQTMERGLLDSYGAFRMFEQSGLPVGVVAPPDILGKTIMTTSTWFAYDVLGAEALANFDIGEVFMLGAQFYFPVNVREDAKVDLGSLENISTRAQLTAGGEPIIAGFVVSDRARRVLVRGIGPGLAGHGVAEPLADPFITLYRHGSNQALFFNDNWGTRPDVAEIEQAAESVGAFALDRASADAAFVMELNPGVFTVHLTSTQAGGSGTALVEVYVLP